ncbi:MAG: DsrE family protein [Sulfurimonas sp.]|jgi:intracellular sulfur oxidation DsrE/DsrF family protein|nr:DsrE family protein [Sulfurimonas sp.]
MKKIILALMLIVGLSSAENITPKLVIDLTAGNIETFEKRVLKAIVVNKNHYESKLQELEVAVVVHGSAYRFFVNDPSKTKYKDDKELLSKYKEFHTRLKSLASTYNVEFFACKVGMTKNGLEDKDMLSFVEIVPTSTIALIDKQNRGYAFLLVEDK